MSVRDSDDSIVVGSRTAGPNEMLSIRSQKEKILTSAPEIPIEEKGSIKEIELNYV